MFATLGDTRSQSPVGAGEAECVKLRGTQDFWEATGHSET